MKAPIPTLLALTLVVFSCHSTTLLPPIDEAQARSWSDMVGDAKVLSIIPAIEDGPPQRRASIIEIEILTKGVSAKTNVTVLWNHTLADATQARKGLPDVGQ